jgi:hypothetical protein
MRKVISEKLHDWNEDRLLVSFRCDKMLWFEFDAFMTEHYGNYKKSILIESLIRKYMKQKKESIQVPI